MRDVLSSGKIVVVESLPHYCARYGVILNRFQVKQGNQMATMFQVLILTNDQDLLDLETRGLNVSNMAGVELLQSNLAVPDSLDVKFLQYLYYSSHNYSIFVPTLNSLGYPPHTLINVSKLQILEITELNVRTDNAVILNDIKKRELPRFQ